MKTTDAQMNSLYGYLDNRGANYSVDRTPTQEKIDLIKQAIKRKNELILKAIDKYTGVLGSKANL